MTLLGKVACAVGILALAGMLLVILLVFLWPCEWRITGQEESPGAQYVARVEDIEAVSAVLRERGARLLYEQPRRGTAGSRVNFIHPKDAGGVLVELVEPAHEVPTHG